MNHEDVQKVSNAANAKITLLQNNFLKYFMRAVMAGFFIVAVMYFPEQRNRPGVNFWEQLCSQLPFF